MNLEPCAFLGLVVGWPTQGDHCVEHVLALRCSAGILSAPGVVDQHHRHTLTTKAEKPTLHPGPRFRVVLAAAAAERRDVVEDEKPYAVQQPLDFRLMRLR